jgi:hypothetical protein
MPDKTIRGAEQVATHAGIADKGTHQQEHRNDAEGIVGHGAHRGLANQFQSRRAADQVTEAGDADQPHCHSNGHAQQHQCKQRDKSQESDGIRAHGVIPWP